jgi:quercetin dioxygenase-like cupin family protein
MHAHEHADRFIVVAQGRGYFHVSDEPVHAFTGDRVRTVPARERDAFVFTRGVVHTFSTDRQPMVLLSCQSPYVPFGDGRQYRVPAVRWTAASSREDPGASVACDPAWTVLAGL